MPWLENDKQLISDAESREYISKGYQFVEGILTSPDDVNALIRSGYTRPHLAIPLRYTFTAIEKKSVEMLGVSVLGVGIVSLGAWSIGKFAKKKFDKRKKENL